MTAAITPPISTGELTRAELAAALDHAADQTAIDYGYDEPMAARLRAGAERIRQEGDR